jgi:hypothetical protein
MKTEQMFTLISGLLGGGIFVKLYEEFQKKGKIKIDESFANLHYEENSVDVQKYLIYITLELLFVNTSSHQKVIKIESVRFYDGENWSNLIFNNHNTSLTKVLSGNNVKCLMYQLHFPQAAINFPLFAIKKDTAYVEIKYKIGEKRNVHFIQGKHFNSKEITPYT